MNFNMKNISIFAPLIIFAAVWIISACDNSLPEIVHCCITSGHIIESWEETTPPTDADYGEETGICEFCKEVIKRVVLPTHDCDRDGYHLMGAWVRTIQPNLLSQGEETITCRRCGEYDKHSVPRINGFFISSAGDMHTAALRTDGSLWTWGNNVFGQLGNGKGGCCCIGGEIYNRVPAQLQPGTAWKSVSAGNSHTVGIMEDGSLWAWGSNLDGILGNGTSGCCCEGGIYFSNIPVPVQPGIKWTSVSAGISHNLAIKEDGSLWSWGCNVAGKLGDGKTVFRLFDPNYPELGGFEAFVNSDIPVPVKPGTKWASVSAGGSHSMAIDEDGSLWAWGCNFWGQLGDGTGGCCCNGGIISRGTPVPIQPGIKWTAVSAGHEFTVAIREDGTLWSWGNNDYGRTGLRDTTGITRMPAQLGHGMTWTYVSAGNEHALAVQSTGALWTWGNNANSRTGLGRTTGVSTTPTMVMRGLSLWAFASAGGTHSMAIRTDGSLWAWGNNFSGRLGDGSTTNRTTPIRIRTAAD